MIKLERGECPDALDSDTIDELTKLYATNNQKDVWNSPKIKDSLKNALTHMSHGKCAYCECALNIESKDITIDHFSPKVTHADRVLEWENLFPSCLRCNRTKNKQEDVIINPCYMEPKQFLGVRRTHPYRLAILDETSHIGSNTIDVLDLNNIKRVMTARFTIGEGVIERLNNLKNEIETCKITKRQIQKLRGILQEGQEDMPYSAVISTLILNQKSYQEIKNVLLSEAKWTDELYDLEKDLLNLALENIEE